jgi:hypothetical protein
MLHLGGKIPTVTDGVVKLTEPRKCDARAACCVPLEGDENVSVIMNDECRC